MIRIGPVATLFMIALGARLALFVCPAHAQPDAGKNGLHFKPFDNKSLGLWEGDRPVLVYNFGKMSHPKVREAGVRSSYVHPIYGLDGESLTDDFPADHYHHHGLFWGWPHVKIADREYDLWKMKGIRIEFVRWLAREDGAEKARLGVENGWFVGGNRVMKEEFWLEIQPASSEGRSIDVRLTWTPTGEPITLGGAEGKSYGGLTLRFAPRAGTVITTPGGPASQDLLVTKMPWTDLSATFRGASKPSGAAIFVHPSHPQFPPEWMTREYGVLAVGWPGVQSATLPPGKATTCKYRLWIHRGTPTAEALTKAYNAFAN